MKRNGSGPKQTNAGEMGNGSTLRNCEREFRKFNNPYVFPILNILTGGFFRFIARLKRNHDKIISAYGLYVTPTWKDLRLPTQPLCLRLMLGAVMTEEPPSSAVTITRNTAATSCSIVSRRVTGRHAAAPSSVSAVTCHVSRLHCSRRGCGLPTGAARGKDGKSAARLASYSGGSSARALVSTPLQLWNVACLVSVWAAVVTGY